jgi:hypothetical protein
MSLYSRRAQFRVWKLHSSRNDDDIHTEDSFWPGGARGRKKERMERNRHDVIAPSSNCELSSSTLRFCLDCRANEFEK